MLSLPERMLTVMPSAKRRLDAVATGARLRRTPLRKALVAIVAVDAAGELKRVQHKGAKVLTSLVLRTAAQALPRLLQHA